ncbi:hypothetical protein B9Z55_021829 [Caenorhabditis nigoni]|uniref:MATH domain-containing protein n=1 Tax=Caenorhabditis nigoni TaxID=1611254 RepID=A0A2G5TTM0_9PELO|nr:hypothetical protein B9Z55_021829 [Caenorhabditis nigoni]
MQRFEKKFVLRHVFKNVLDMKEEKYYYSPFEEHFGISWRIVTVHKNGHLAFHLQCQLKKQDKWCIDLKWEHKLLSIHGKPVTRIIRKNYGNSENASNNWGWPEFVRWHDFFDHVVDYSFSVEAHVTIMKMTGIKLRNFDESAAKYSDVVLIVEGTKFYVSKLVRIFMCTLSSIISAPSTEIRK